MILAPDGRFLLGQRPREKVYGGYWEFPGGKVAPGESALAALERELAEELGIRVVRAYPWITRDYDYEHAAVRLRFFRVLEWSGTPHARENQRFAWQRPGAVEVAPLLPANAPVLRALALPALYAVSHAAELGHEEFLRRLERALAAGLKLVQLREKEAAPRELERLAQRAVALAHRHGARLLVNTDAELARRCGADGVHLTAAQLRALGQRPAFELVGASCHDGAELARAAALGADFAVLGPVRPTASHPGATAMGWEQFAALVRDCALPVYAIGGMSPPELENAWRCGAHGIAMMRAAWS